MTEAAELTPEELQHLETARRRKARAARKEEELTGMLDDAHIVLDEFASGKDPRVLKTVLGQLIQFMEGLDLVAFTNPTALLDNSIISLAGGSAQPAAVANVSSISSTVADKLQELTDQMGEDNDATALDKLLKLTKGLKTLDQPAVARRLALAERVFDQSLANSLEVAAGGTELQVEADLALVGSQLTTANDELDKARRVLAWLKPFQDGLSRSRNATDRGVRERLMLEAAEGKTPTITSTREVELDERLDRIKKATSEVTTNESTKPNPGTHITKLFKRVVIDPAKLQPEDNTFLGVSTS